MSDIAIKIKNLSKVYRLYDRPIDRLKEALNPLKKSYHQEFYALHDVDIEIKKGDTIGIIGKNGAGKSTLLKIITGVLNPSGGEIFINGNISSLLELGAGFNPDYTGIENIYLQGTLMGYKQNEIEDKISSILDFADIGDFVYQPVKSYSSGMFARLAFAVAINVEPDILIVDEALSVGDIRFQQKCLRKMDDLQKLGKTILFVSHDLTIIKKLCNKSIYLKDGTVGYFESSEKVCELFFNDMYMNENIPIEELTHPEKEYNNSISNYDYLEDMTESNSIINGDISIDKLAFVDDYDNRIKILHPNDDVTLKVLFTANEEISNFGCGLMFKDSKGIGVFGTNSFMNENEFKVNKIGKYLYSFKFKVPNISNNTYSIDIAISDGTMLNHNHLQWIHDAISVEINKAELGFNNNLYVALPKADIAYEKLEQVKI